MTENEEKPEEKPVEESKRDYVQEFENSERRIKKLEEEKAALTKEKEEGETKREFEAPKDDKSRVTVTQKKLCPNCGGELAEVEGNVYGARYICERCERGWAEDE